MNHKMIPLEMIINEIGDEFGNKYSWFIIEIEGYTVGPHELDGEVTIMDIHNRCTEPFGYYEVSWDFLKQTTPRLRGIIDFTIFGFKDKEIFIKKLEQAKKENKKWCDVYLSFNYEIIFEVVDGAITEISGLNTALVARLKKYFSPLPIFLM